MIVHFQNIDTAAVEDAAGFDDDAAGFDDDDIDIDIDIDDLLEAEAVDPDDDIEEDLTDYFDIRVKRRMVCNTHTQSFLYSFLFINLFLFLFVSFLFYFI